MLLAVWLQAQALQAAPLQVPNTQTPNRQTPEMQTPALTLQDWQAQRPILQDQLQRYIYGFRPRAAKWQGHILASGQLSQTRVAGERDQGRPAYYEHHRLLLKTSETAPAFKQLDLLVVLPTPDFAGITVMFLNKCGNHTLLPDPELQLNPAPLTPACQGSGRGWRKDFWALETALEKGLGVITWHESQIAPDFPAGYQAALQQWPAASLHPGSEPGLLSLWSWGLSAVLDYFKSQERFGVLGLMGHSRRGKTALLTAALDPQVDFVLAHQSGTLGAVAVQDHPAESLDSITRSFPHWFTPYASRYAGQAQALPVPPGALLQLQAPRPVLLSDGDFDFWASPAEAHRNLERSLGVYQLYLTPFLAQWETPPPLWTLRQLDRWGSAREIEQDRRGLPLGHFHLPTWHSMNADYWKAMAAFLHAQYPTGAVGALRQL